MFKLDYSFMLIIIIKKKNWENLTLARVARGYVRPVICYVERLLGSS